MIALNLTRLDFSIPENPFLNNTCIVDDEERMLNCLVIELFDGSIRDRV